MLLERHQAPFKPRNFASAGHCFQKPSSSCCHAAASEPLLPPLLGQLRGGCPICSASLCANVLPGCQGGPCADHRILPCREEHRTCLRWPQHRPHHLNMQVTLCVWQMSINHTSGRLRVLCFRGLDCSGQPGANCPNCGAACCNAHMKSLNSGNPPET